MCSINGFNFGDEEKIKKMNLLTFYRGPDGTGFFCNDKISLGHNRLSILDLRNVASQPMSDNDDSLTIVFNGEIYNFKDLRGELKNDYVFKTESDTEVILAAYKKWGAECLRRFNGIFAFAIWDKNKEELFLARDPLGVKPLYYYLKDGKFIFSSEAKGILVHDIDSSFNEGAFNVYFRLLYVPEPLTPWKFIFKFPPAHYGLFKAGKLSLHQYWVVDEFDTFQDKKEIKNLIKDGFKTAIKRQLVSDRPLGLYLSGGIDSTASLGVMSELLDKPVQTFTVGFEVEPEQELKFNADANLARKTSGFFHSDHREIVLKPIDVIDNFEKIVWHADDLVSNHTQTAMYVLSGMTKQFVDVVLSGDGGDELFCGYDRYYLNFMLDKVQSIPEVMRKNFLVKALFGWAGKRELYEKLNIKPGLERFLGLMSQKEENIGRFLNPDFNRSSATPDFLKKKFFHRQERLDFTKKLQYLDIQTWLLDDALNRADRMSMAHGLEQRVPILDKDMVGLAMAIPSAFNMDKKGRGKKIFKEALKDYIPEFIYNEPKRGWFSPVAKWLRGGLKDWAYDILSPQYNSGATVYLDFAEIKDILDKHMSGERYALNTIWSLINFQVWLKLFKK